MNGAQERYDGDNARLTGIDHVQLTMPAGREPEEAARDFYTRALGLREIEKPEALRDRAGLWFEGDGFQVHMGIEEVIETRRHPGFVTDDLAAMRERVSGAGYEVEEDPGLPGIRRFYTRDPFRNRIEIQQYVEGWAPGHAP